VLVLQDMGDAVRDTQRARGDSGSSPAAAGSSRAAAEAAAAAAAGGDGGDAAAMAVDGEQQQQQQQEQAEAAGNGSSSDEDDGVDAEMEAEVVASVKQSRDDPLAAYDVDVEEDGQAIAQYLGLLQGPVGTRYA
jgi:hypothetical protein